MGLKLTDLRKILIIQILSDCEKWRTQDIIKKVKKLEYKFLNDQDTSFRREKLSVFDSAKISPILKELRENVPQIIETETVPKNEKQGRGPGGDRHWLIKDKFVFIKIISIYSSLNPKTKLLSSIFSEDFYYFGSKIMNSKYGKSVINDEMIPYFKEKYEKLNDNDIKNMRKIFSISPTAVLESITSMILIENENFSPENKRSILVYTIYRGLMVDLPYDTFKAPFPFDCEVKFTYYPDKIPKCKNMEIEIISDDNSVKTHLKYE